MQRTLSSCKILNKNHSRLFSVLILNPSFQDCTRFTTPIFNTLDIHHPRHSPPKTFTTPDIHHPLCRMQLSPPPTLLTPFRVMRHSPPEANDQFSLQISESSLIILSKKPQGGTKRRDFDFCNAVWTAGTFGLQKYLGRRQLEWKKFGLHTFGLLRPLVNVALY